MIKKLLALVGVLLILASTFVGLAWAHYWKAARGPDLEVGKMGLWQSVHSNVALTPDLALILLLVGLLLGVALTIPWWRERLKHESVWWNKRDEPLDTPPRVPAGL